ncbi:MAG: hypothetical protein EOP11_06910 [Proteobacteria bacterium]|nr:MAG: hypothetical protein EOP11_06910 [Pseudomonadota bacterium]
MKKKKPATAKAPKKTATYRYKKFTLPTFRSPLMGEGEVIFEGIVDHAFFLRCCELYRVLDLLERTTDKLVDVYSKYRNRNQFTETLTFRYFDSEEALVARFDPKLAADMFFLFNLLYELRIQLTYTDELPMATKKTIDDSMLTLREAWNKLVDAVEVRYKWQFKKLSMPEGWAV